MKRILFITILLVIINGCINKNKVIAPPQMKLIMWDLISADEYKKLIVAKDSTAILKNQNQVFYNAVFKMHNISKEQFYESYNYYQSHPNEMKILLDSIAAYGVKKRDSATFHLKNK